MSGGENGGVTTAQVCIRCGNPVSPATSYLTEIGLLCWPCFGQFQSQREQADLRDAELQRSLTRRAQRLAGLHWIMLATTMLAATGHDFPGSGRSALLLVIAGLGIGLALRRRWAFEAALVLDTVGALGLFALAIVARKALPLLLEVFPASLLALTWTLRSAYAEELPLAAGGGSMASTAPTARIRKRRWPLLVLALATLAGGGTATYLWRRPRPLPDPALELMRTTLPRWELERNRPWSKPAGPKGVLVVGAQRWPALAKAFEDVDRAWPEEAPVRAATASVNRALADAGLPYLASVWIVYDKPYVLSHALVARVPWHMGARTIEVLRLRRLDDIGIDFAFDGVTQDGLPVVMLDRVEATLARELPAMYATRRELRSSDFSDFDRAALARMRSFLEARLGPQLARAALALRERNRLIEEMRTRFRGDVNLAVPERLVLGDDWLEDLQPSTRLDRPGGPLFLDTDLKALVTADRELRAPSTAEAFRGAIELFALTTEAHEARHATEASDRTAPPPSALLDVMPDSSTRMMGMADSELQAFLGELHDAAIPACVNLGGIMRTVYGAFARREPHYYATLALLEQLGADTEKDPVEQLAALCDVTDGDLRNSMAAIWRRLYGAPMALGERTGAAGPAGKDR